MVHPSIPAGPARACRGRLIGAILCGIGVFALGLCVLLPGKAISSWEAPILAGAGVLAVFALLCAASRGVERAAAGLALLAGTAAAWSACRLGGGFASPLALGLAALPLEAWMVARSRSAVFAGCAAALIAAGALVWTGVSTGSEILAHPAGWLPVLAWGVTLWSRAFRTPSGESPASSGFACAESGTVVLRFEPSGEIGDASASAQDALGLAPELLLGNGFFERLHVGDRVTFLCALGDMKHGAAGRQLELRVRLPGAAQAAFRSFSLHLARTGEAAFPFAGLLRDIGELQALRDALEAAHQARSEAEAEKAQLLATLGHELRTPLNAILGFSAILGSDAFGAARDPRQKEYAGLIQGCGEHLLAVIDAMLDLGQLRAGVRQVEPEIFCIGQAVETCRAMMVLHADTKGVALQLSPDMQPMSVSADRRIVQQILVNLVSNAVKFTPAGGRVTVGARLDGKRLRLCVSDTGVGIACEDLDRLGTPWTRLDAARACKAEGHGLGLALVRELAALHGGGVSIESARGEGTMVVVSLPNTVSPASGALNRQSPLISIGEKVSHGGFRKTA